MNAHRNSQIESFMSRPQNLGDGDRVPVNAAVHAALSLPIHQASSPRALAELIKHIKRGISLSHERLAKK